VAAGKSPSDSAAARGCGTIRLKCMHAALAEAAADAPLDVSGSDRRALRFLRIRFEEFGLRTSSSFVKSVISIA